MILNLATLPLLFSLGIEAVSTSGTGTIAAAARTSVLVVVGAEGTAEYGREFRRWSDRWRNAAAKGNARFHRIGIGTLNETTDRHRLFERLDKEPATGLNPLWLVLIGHGTFDGRSARFNLRGPDLTAAELKTKLSRFRRPVIVINCASASAPFLRTLSAKNRIVVTACKSGYEQNYARFGGFLAAALTDPAADLDRDGQTSLKEAWLTACRRTQAFYREEGRLATEHALLDDNGDRLGTPVSAFVGLRPVENTVGSDAIDGDRAHQIHLIPSPAERKLSPGQRRQRNELELTLIALRKRKSELSSKEYDARLESLLLKLAAVYGIRTAVWAKRPKRTRQR
ncbi:MAG: hypothetical protein IID45_00985 [Planctomycetes bacterium]|nr:hypothetical protein [Planctomycetota bacterium]